MCQEEQGRISIICGIEIENIFFALLDELDHLQKQQKIGFLTYQLPSPEICSDFFPVELNYSFPISK